MKSFAMVPESSLLIYGRCRIFFQLFLVLRHIIVNCSHLDKCNGKLLKEMIEFCAVKHRKMTKIMLNPTDLCLKEKKHVYIKRFNC